LIKNVPGLPLLIFCVFLCLDDDMPHASDESLAGWTARHFMRQKNERRAPGQSLDRPWGTSVFTGNIAVKKLYSVVMCQDMNKFAAQMLIINLHLIWNRCLLLASISRSRGLRSDDDNCSFTLATSLGCKMSNQLWPSKSPWKHL
jgi:hypothetical protein